MEESLVPLVPMSHTATAHIRSHRKPRRAGNSSLAMRAGVAGGVLSTLAVAGASSAANAAEPVTQTIELPTLTADLATQIAESADATQLAAANYELQAERDAAAAKAAQEARKDLAEAKEKAEAKKKAEAARKAAAEAAVSRSAERATLAASTSTSVSSSETTQVAAPASGSVATVIAFLNAQLGDAYVMGATGPNAWDCSSLVQAAFKQVGVDLPRVSQDQSMQGTEVSLSNLQVGDILYWGAKGSAYHVGVYVGNGQYLDAANPSKGVVVQDLSGYPASGAVRVL
ncbi:C40 family peptidase [Streptomyces lacrimifluminis]|uniref:Glycoside hydrolase n=1 Tax=Streptomyces lacrimifluminis TaxID=1500077 RepID=A0A917P879_9ACTN|nr:C40 family peptidase [Streptomyces lacrimifluminis]GGJ65999.1 glycoside hydrolase [Streptomyces lacrimifluminis]